MYDPYEYGIAALYAVEAMRPEIPVKAPKESEVRARQLADGCLCREPIRHWEW